MRLTMVTKWCPDPNPCLSSMCVQVKVGCLASFPQLVKCIYERMQFDHNAFTFDILVVLIETNPAEYIIGCHVKVVGT